MSVTTVFDIGINAEFLFDDAGGSPVAVDGYLTKVDRGETSGAPNATVLGARAEDVLAGTPTDGTLSEEGLWDETQDAIFWASLSRQRTYKYGPNGNASGNAYVTGECIGTSYSISGEVDGAIKFTAAQQLTGTQTAGSY
jgi:hypothetical protein